jgi:hypothetical protein
MEGVLEAALEIFCRATGPQVWDYFLLHAVTAAFSLLPICTQLPRSCVLRLGRRMVCGLLAAYVAQGCPELQPWASCIGQGEGLVTRAGTRAGSYSERWERLRIEATSEEKRPQLNEHAFKLLWMCMDYDLAPNYTADGDRLTLPHWLLMAAATKVVRGELSGRDGEQPLSRLQQIAGRPL